MRMKNFHVNMIRFPIKFSIRRLNTSIPRLNNVFGEITQVKESYPINMEAPKSKEENPKDLLPKEDEPLQKYYLQQAQDNAITDDKFITPLKRELFQLNIKQNGFFKNDQLVENNGKFYKLSLTDKEIDILEPTIYLKSLRIKSSMKKATVVNRFVRGLNVKNAINQLHFNPKKMSTELEKLLKQGLEQAKELGINEDRIYIQALWTGSDGGWQKRLDPKSRGRAGIIRHRYIHLKVILKSELTKKRINWEKSIKQDIKRPKTGLNGEPLNFRNVAWFKW